MFKPSLQKLSHQAAHPNPSRALRLTATRPNSALGSVCRTRGFSSHIQSPKQKKRPRGASFVGMAEKEGLIRAALPPLLEPFQGALPYGYASKLCPRQRLSNPRVLISYSKPQTKKRPKGASFVGMAEKEGLIRAALPPLLEPFQGALPYGYASKPFQGAIPYGYASKLCPRQSLSNPRVLFPNSKPQTKKRPRGASFVGMAEKEGFEPSIRD